MKLDKEMNVENGENENSQASRQQIPKDSEFVAIGEVVRGNQSPMGKPANTQSLIKDENIGVSIGAQSRLSEPLNMQSPSQKPNILDPNFVKIQPAHSVKRRFGRKRPLPRQQDDLKMQLGKSSMTQSLLSQPSQDLSSQLDADCRRCKENKVEMKRLQQTITRMIREADSAKKRQDNILATSLSAQEAMQKELTFLRSSNVKLHIELTDMKAVLRDVQSALGRCKF